MPMKKCNSSRTNQTAAPVTTSVPRPNTSATQQEAPVAFPNIPATQQEAPGTFPNIPVRQSQTESFVTELFVTELEEQTPDLGCKKDPSEIENPGVIEVDMGWFTKNPVVGSIDTQNKEDQYKVEMKEGYRYQIDIRGKANWDYYNSHYVKNTDAYRKYAPNVELTLTDPFLRGVYGPQGDYISRDPGRLGQLGRRRKYGV